MVFSAEFSCNNNAGCRRKPDEQIDNKADCRACGTDCRKRVFSCRFAHESANDNHVSRIVEHLQHAGEHKRYGKHDNRAENAALCHINAVPVIHHITSQCVL